MSEEIISIMVPAGEAFYFNLFSPEFQRHHKYIWEIALHSVYAELYDVYPYYKKLRLTIDELDPALHGNTLAYLRSDGEKIFYKPITPDFRKLRSYNIAHLTLSLSNLDGRVVKVCKPALFQFKLRKLEVRMSEFTLDFIFSLDDDQHQVTREISQNLRLDDQKKWEIAVTKMIIPNPNSVNSKKLTITYRDAINYLKNVTITLENEDVDATPRKIVDKIRRKIRDAIPVYDTFKISTTSEQRVWMSSSKPLNLVFSPRLAQILGFPSRNCPEGYCLNFTGSGSRARVTSMRRVIPTQDVKLFGFLMCSLTRPSILNGASHHLLNAFPIKFNALDDEIVIENHSLEWHDLSTHYIRKIDFEFLDCEKQPLYSLDNEHIHKIFLIDLKIREKK